MEKGGGGEQAYVRQNVLANPPGTGLGRRLGQTQSGMWSGSEAPGR